MAPGPVYVLIRAPKVLAGLTLVYAADVLCYQHLCLRTSIWAKVIASLIILLGLSIVDRRWKSYRTQREAVQRGAVTPPVVRHKWPWSLDIVKQARDAARHGYIGEMVWLWVYDYGAIFKIPILHDHMVFTTEPEHIKAILSTDFANHEKGQMLHEQMATLMGTGVFNSDGEMWKFHRNMARPFFSRDRISHFDIFDRHAEDAINKLKARLRDGYAVDMQDLVSRFTLDSATEFLFGCNVSSLSAPLPYPSASDNAALNTTGALHPANQFARALRHAQAKTIIRSNYLEAWPLFEFWKDRVQKHMTVIDDFLNPIVEAAISTRREQELKGTLHVSEDDKSFLDHMVRVVNDAQVLKDEILNILLAGRDTTAAALTCAIYALAENPSVMQRLRNEILSNLGPVRRPTYDDIRGMKYLRAFINEVLRMYPPVPFNMRVSKRAAIWPSRRADGKGYYVPPNTKCTYSVLVMHRRKDLWGPDALTFDPDRFLDERVQRYLTPQPFIFLPFNAGPRICLGQQFAYNEISFMLIRLLQQFTSIDLALNANPSCIPPPLVAQCRAASIASEKPDRIWLRNHLTLYAHVARALGQHGLLIARLGLTSQ